MTRIIDQGSGMSMEAVNEAINWQKNKKTLKSLYLRMRNVQFGLKTVLNSIEAQYCQLKISSKVEVGTEILFSMQTRKKEINLTMDSLKVQMDELAT